jgi:hypothetical protein
MVAQAVTSPLRFQQHGCVEGPVALPLNKRIEQTVCRLLLGQGNVPTAASASQTPTLQTLQLADELCRGFFGVGL